MRNLYLLETPKPSRLHLGKSGLVLCDLVFNPTTINSQHIYITNSEKPKEGDWVYENNLNQETKIYQIIKRDGRLMFFRFRSVPIWLDENQHGCKKIILTTDPDLIKDGVQELDDEFLEWFVKNPSCESVKVEILDTFKKTNEVYVDEIAGGNYYEIIKQYKIIIPQEETKQETRVFGTKEDKTIQVGHPDKQERTGSLVECIQNIINDQLKVISEIEKDALEEPKQLQKMKNKIFYEYSYRDYFLAKLKDESFVVVFKAYGKDGYLQDEFQNLIDINSIEREANGKEYYDYFTKRGIKQGALCSRWRNEFKPIFQFLESTKKYDPQPVIVTLGHGKHYPNGHGMSLCNYTFDFKSNSLLSMTKEEPIDKSFYENTDLTITIEPQTSKEDDERWSLASAKEFALNHFKKSDEVPSKGMFTYELLLRILEAGIECGYKFGTKHQASVKYSEEDRFEGSQPKSQRMFSEMQVHQIIELIRITGLSPEFIMKQFNEK